MSELIDFYGVDSTVVDNGHLIKLGDEIIVAEEDEDDGYRSYMYERDATPDEIAQARFPLSQPVKVRQVGPEELDGRFVNHDDRPEGYVLVDETGHVWLECYTEYYDRYYPCAVFNYYPKEN